MPVSAIIPKHIEAAASKLGMTINSANTVRTLQAISKDRYKLTVTANETIERSNHLLTDIFVMDNKGNLSVNIFKDKDLKSGYTVVNTWKIIKGEEELVKTIIKHPMKTFFGWVEKITAIRKGNSTTIRTLRYGEDMKPQKENIHIYENEGLKAVFSKVFEYDKKGNVIGYDDCMF